MSRVPYLFKASMSTLSDPASPLTTKNPYAADTSSTLFCLRAAIRAEAAARSSSSANSPRTAAAVRRTCSSPSRRACASAGTVRSPGKNLDVAVSISPSANIASTRTAWLVSFKAESSTGRPRSSPASPSAAAAPLLVRSMPILASRYQGCQDGFASSFRSPPPMLGTFGNLAQGPRGARPDILILVLESTYQRGDYPLVVCAGQAQCSGNSDRGLRVLESSKQWRNRWPSYPSKRPNVLTAVQFTETSPQGGGPGGQDTRTHDLSGLRCIECSRTQIRVFDSRQQGGNRMRISHVCKRLRCGVSQVLIFIL